MQICTQMKFVLTAGLIVLLIFGILPVGAENQTISIAYRGPGGNYLGDTIVFDGINTYGNTTLVRMTGPNLPAEGVPIYDMNGIPGTGNIIPMNPDGTWRFGWYTGSIQGVNKIVTARYYITAFDKDNPEKFSTTSILLKRPEFYFSADPPSAGFGDYVQLIGTSEKGTSSIRFEIADSTGRIVHTYESTVSSSGYVNKAFHVDMPPGLYTITMSSPSVRTTYRNYLIINSTSGETAVTGTLAHTVTPVTTPVLPATGSLSVSSTPAGASVFINSVMVGTTPYTTDKLAAGTYMIEVKAPGYVTSATTIDLHAGENTAISPILVHGSGIAPLPPVIPVLALLIAIFLAVSFCRRQEH